MRGLGYFIEPLLVIALFAKRELSVTFRGFTNVSNDLGVDVLRSVTMPFLKRFGLEVRAPSRSFFRGITTCSSGSACRAQDDVHLQIVRRGAPPAGMGEVLLNIPVVRSVQTLHLTDPGRVKRVRGVAYGVKVRGITQRPDESLL